jgi:RNA polymerase-binding protein DksA
MARSTRTSLAAQVASVARKAISRRPAPDEADGPVPATKQAPAKKAPTKKASSGAAVGKKTPARKAPARKTAQKETAQKETAQKKTALKKAAATAPARKSATTTPAKKASVKKTASTKSAASASAATAVLGDLAVKEGEEAWTAAELEGVLEELHESRAHSAEILEHQESELSGLMRDAGDGAGHDQADMGATSFERDHELTVLNIEREKVAQIDRALARIDDGTYGVCESCGNPIGKMRVMAFPRATLCMTCKQREERR